MSKIKMSNYKCKVNFVILHCQNSQKVSNSKHFHARELIPKSDCSFELDFE